MHSKENRDGWTSPITYEGSSEDTILGARAELLNPLSNSKVLENSSDLQPLEMPQQRHNGITNYPEVRIRSDNDYLSSNKSRNNHNLEEIDEISRNVIRDMNTFGLCVVNNFLGTEKGLSVLDEVLKMYNAGVFENGQLVSNRAGTNKSTIRGDQITWLDGKERDCQNIGKLISKVDAIIMRANKMSGNGKMGKYIINNRTKVIFNCNYLKFFLIICFELISI